MRFRKAGAAILAVIILASAVALPAAAKKNEIHDLDVVVVIDTSGSMRTSDPGRISVAAARMLANMMPAENSKIGLVAFDTSATVLTRDGSNNPTLTSLSNINNVNYIREKANSIEFSGDTGIGNALYAATELLEKCSSADHKKAIILFTDGMDDLPTSADLKNCLNNEKHAVSWAESNDCPIYCVGFDYITASGASSMGSSGEGIKKLTSYSDATGGYTKATSDIYEIEQLFIDMLATICSLYYVAVDTIPGDGERHETIININPNVIEANIRISSSTEDAVASGKIELFSPDGKKVKLSNRDNIRYDVDATAASIKVLEPENGDWLLVVDDMFGNDVKIGLLEHYSIEIDCDISYNGKTADTLIEGDMVTVTTKILDSNTVVTDSAIYDIVNDAHISLVCDGQEQTQKMERVGNSFVGDFTVESAGTYDVTVSIDSNSFHREQTFAVLFGEKPPVGVTFIKDFENIGSLKKGESAEITDLLSYAKDDEGANFWIDNVYAEDSGVISAVYDQASDTLRLEGLKGGRTSVFIEYLDDNGLTGTAEFRVRVVDPVEVAMSCAGLLLFILLLFLLIRSIRKKGLRIKGKLEIEKLEVNDDSVISINPTRNEFGEVDDRFIVGLNNTTKNLHKLIESIADSWENSEVNSERKFSEYYNSYEEQITLDSFKAIAEKTAIIGTYKGKNGIEISVPENKLLMINSLRKGTLKLGSGAELTVEFTADDEENTPIITFIAKYTNRYKSAKKKKKHSPYVSAEDSSTYGSDKKDVDPFDFGID